MPSYHFIPNVHQLKVKSSFWHRGVGCCELEASFPSFGSNFIVNLALQVKNGFTENLTNLITVREECLDDLQSFMIDLLVFMRLESFNLVESTTLLHHHSHLVGLVKLLGCSENVGNTIKNYTNSFVILCGKKVTEWFKNTLSKLNHETSMQHTDSLPLHKDAQSAERCPHWSSWSQPRLPPSEP